MYQHCTGLVLLVVGQILPVPMRECPRRNGASAVVRGDPARNPDLT